MSPIPIEEQYPQPTAYEQGCIDERRRIVEQVEGLIEKARKGRGSWEWVGTTTTAYRDVLALIQEEPTP